MADLASLVAPTWPDYIDSAVLLARCVRLARKEGSPLALQHGKDAIELLHRLAPYQAVAIRQRIRDGDFDALRSLPGLAEDFRRLQAEVEQRAGLSSP